MTITQNPDTQPKVAILYQALPPPIIKGQRKKPRVGGYADSGADIGFVLGNNGIEVVTPVKSPDPSRLFDWVFPDTEVGIHTAITLGANVIWANTVLFSGHPVEKFMNKVKIVGQLPSTLDNFDDKYLANQLFTDSGLPVAESFLVGRQGAPAEVFLDSKDKLDGNKVLAERGIDFPVIVKPVRGRGSQGVTLVQNSEELNETIVELLDSNLFGCSVIVEQYLNGEEITVTVLPPKSTSFDGTPANRYWALSPVVREGHKNGVVPFNGDVPPTQNSRAMNAEERQTDAALAIAKACEDAAEIAKARNIIRIDCRLDSRGTYRIFDFNMKPSMTGAGRPGRDHEDSLSVMAAAAHGWTYYDLLKSMLDSAWST